jgi:hypothetical protein
MRDLRDPEADGFGRRVGEHYAPAPLSPARRAALDEALRQRIERSGPARRLAPALAAAALATLVWWSWPDAPEPELASAASTRWEQDLFYAGDAASSTAVEAEGLPEDYRAIAVAFLDAEL